MKFRESFLFFIISFVLLSPSFYLLNAQVTSASGDQFIDMEVSPRLPSPGDRVEVTLDSSIYNLNYANIKWTVGGQFLSGGVGMIKVNFVLAKNDSDTPVAANITLQSGGVINKSLTIKTSHLDVLWQPLTQVHPFYEGLPLFTHQSSIQFVAIPSFGDNTGVAYKWSVDGGVKTDNSGYGKNSFVYTDSILSKPTLIHVEARSAGGQMAEKYFFIKAGNPKVQIYVNNPLLGVLYNNALPNDYDLPSKEFILRAEPYFFTAVNPQVSWSLNNQVVGNYTNKDLALSGGEGQGQAIVSVKVSDPAKILENASEALHLIFKE